MDAFREAYTSLNERQKKAVDTIEGPVMVIAGPGTGKTQVLALRIANILEKTDTPPDGVLCLTFTNAGVKAMRERLVRLIGPTATRVRIATFHAFALDAIEEFHEVLGVNGVPTLLDDAQSVAIFDELLGAQPWKHLRPRGNPSMYFRDLVSLISTLKRDRVTSQAFRVSVEQDIERIKSDPESISSRGETKGQLKKEAQTKLESLERTLEAADFYALYESLKRERNLIDYNDALDALVRIVESDENAAATMRERYLYVLVDEHQDSSAIQNEFLSAVWKGSERPNIFVVGDDRQLIYGFGGASLAYFEAFKHAFGTAELITLTHNYRSTQHVLDIAEALLQSSLTSEQLISTTQENHPIALVECDYPRDEILSAGLDIRARILQGVAPEQCAILVPKNHQVKAAVQTLRDMGIPVAASSSLLLFEIADTQSFLHILRSIASPHDAAALSRTLLDPLSGITVLDAHQFLSGVKTRELSVTELCASGIESIKVWGERLALWIEQSTTLDAYALIQLVGGDVFIASAHNDESMRKRVEIIRTLLHLALSQNTHTRLLVHEFVVFVDRLLAYEEDIPLAVFGAHTGVRVLTLHGSKGLEFENVWIAHMDERSLMGAKRQAFTLPLELAERAQEDALLTKKRELYVALTRAKRYLTISYARTGYTGADQDLASIIQELPETLFHKQTRQESEARILDTGANLFITRETTPRTDERAALHNIVREEYVKKKVSVTMLNNFYECSWKWYFRNLLQLPEPLTESLYVGNIVHEMIEYILKGGTDAEGEIKRVSFIEARQDESFANRLMHEARPIVECWQKIYARELTRPFSVERNFSYHDADFAHLTITGKIDVVEEIISGEVRVTDWKTGGTKTKSDIEKIDDEGRLSTYLRQLAMYSYLIEGATHGDTTVSESRLVFLEAKDGDKNATYSRRITNEEVSRLKQDILDYDRYLSDGSWMSRPCAAKTYGGEVCQYCAMAEKFGVLRK